MSSLSASRSRIGRVTLPEKVLLAAGLLGGLAACTSNHHVSAWGSSGTPALGDFVETPDLDARLAIIDAEASALGLHLTTEIPATLPHAGGPLRIRGYEGTDSLGRPIHAVRVASARAVVMALGPLDPGDPERVAPTALVPALIEDAGSRSVGAFQSGTDLTGDSGVSVVARNDAGRLSIWRVNPLGASPYPIALTGVPTRGFDADGDGRVDLASEVPVDAGDPIAPRLVDVATFDGVGYSNRTAGARAFHASLAEPIATTKSDASPSDEVRLRKAIERAWHATLAGRSRDDALKALGREPVPARLRGAFERWTTTISSVPATPASGTPGGT